MKRRPRPKSRAKRSSERRPDRERDIGNSKPRDLGRPFVVRDPVHGYLVIAAHERLIIDQSVSQRLRRIAQTGLAEFVFPEARTSRFVHSLGAMHVASRFVLAALENAEEDVALRFFEEIDSRIPKLGGEREGSSELLQQDGTLSALSTVRSSFRFSKLRTLEIKQLMAITEAGVRLAALFHDLGHLPFSHDGEYALADFAIEQKAKGAALSEGLELIVGEGAPHEVIGHGLAELVFRSLGTDVSPAVRSTFELATAILNAKNPEYSQRKKTHANALQWLHSLVDGEIDADRADYLLRDGQALGLDFAHYDVERLASNLVLLYDDDMGFVTAVNEKGLPALESYCLSRSRSSQVFVRHHKVAQAGAALRHVSTVGFETPAAKVLLDLLADLGKPPAGNDPKKLLDAFAPFDDPWWLQVLRSLQGSTTGPLTQACLEFVLDRRRTLRSLWKRKGDLTEAQAKKLNEKVDKFFVSHNSIELAQARRKLLADGVLLSPFKFRPFAKRPDGQSVMLIKEKNRIEPASKRSALIACLEGLWLQDIHLYAFVLDDSPISLQDVVAKITEE